MTHEEGDDTKMNQSDEQSYPAAPSSPPIAGDETATLLGSLERQRAIFAWKCGDLDEAGLRATLGPSAMTLGGMLKHLARVEADVFANWLSGSDLGPPWDEVDWNADPDWDWQSASSDSSEQLYTLWRAAVDRSRLLVAEALAEGGLDHPAAEITDTSGVAPTLRYMLIVMIEEYGRHNGHADLLRESVDGLVGEDPPA